MLDGHHYLGSSSLCGAQIKYVIWCEGVGYIGALAFSSASWSLKARDDYVGWNKEAHAFSNDRAIQQFSL